MRPYYTGDADGKTSIHNRGNKYVPPLGKGLFGTGFFQEYNHARSIFSQNTNVHPAFGAQPKIERNRKLVQSIYRQTQGYMLIGDRLNEIMSDPLHRPPRLVLQRAREEASIFGRSRGFIRPAAPQMVKWKNRYWSMQRPPYRSPIGPFTQGQLEQQSILYRIRQFAGIGQK